MTQKNFINFKSWLALVVILTPFVTYAQSINNGSFEAYSSCSSAFTNVTNWSRLSTVDYYSSICNYINTVSGVGNIVAQQGAGYIGTQTEWNGSDVKEYAINRLSSKMVAGTTYQITFWTSHLYGSVTSGAMGGASFVDMAVANQGYLGLAFSAVAPTSANTSGGGSGSTSIFDSWNANKRVYIPATNTQVYGTASRNTWVPVTLYYTADGTEEYMTVGQFRQGSGAGSGMVYYMYDSFSMTSVPSASLTKAVSPATITDGNTATYTFTISNTQAGNVALSGIRFTDTLPSGLRIASNPNVVVSGLTGGTVTATAGGTSIAVSNYSMAANTTATITVNVTNAPGQLNASCGSNPAAFTNSASNISNFNALTNDVGNVCLIVNSAPIVVPGCNYTSSSLGKMDPIQGLWESLIMKMSNGDFLVTGRATHGDGSTNLTTFTKVASGSNGYSFTGTPMMMTGASTSSTSFHQYFLLTTTGLYKWGAGAVVNGSNTMVQLALPSGLAIGNIQMIDAGKTGNSTGSLMILTKQGEIWTYASSNPTNVQGDGNINTAGWHKVMTAAGVPLTGMKDVKTGGRSAMATDGYNIYTWGDNVYLGNSTAVQNRGYATLMNAPTGITLPILQQDINSGSSATSYYLRDSNGKVFTLGNNGSGQLGIGNTTSQTAWVTITSVNEEPEAAGNQTDVTLPVKKVIWISASNHASGTDTQFNIITEDNMLYACGSDDLDKLGVVVGAIGTSLSIPTAVTTNNGANKLSGKIVFVESAGKTSVLVKKGSDRYGFAGEATSGGDGCPGCPYRPREYIFTAPSIGLVCGNTFDSIVTNPILINRAK